MFDISFGEILLIGIVALVVLGPERLPTVARTLGALVARAQRFVASVKADIHQQANLSGLDGLRNDIQDAASSFKAQMEAEVQGVRQEMAAQSAQLQQLSSEAKAPLEEAAHTIHGGLDLQAESAPAAVVSAVVAEKPAVELPVRDENQLDLFDAPPPASQPSSESRPHA
ncbi:twin-arginine translocation protein TatB [Aquitalea magnusonii]|uniref:Sec-independent protein translocase protein TatB n=1 Tax=Aquitalea magnusonii TaxID=332411 RepID=A0A3G9GIF2_9NEIS|nr:Sec-independent protein translocase protein TatB [Aquitalea magnusonii]BBF87285.1 twin-arginine translocation protein TatB [Aquitalea magnusonii]